MDKATFSRIENYMMECMMDSAHDREHVYRVLYFAADIAKYESGVDTDVLLAACLLHDIGRAEQYKDPKASHALVGSLKAYEFLLTLGWRTERAAHVRDCVASHRFRGDTKPASIEAKILFDADKLDAAGTMGVARTLLYQGIVSEPLYTLNARGDVDDGADTDRPSFFREYKYKLEKVYDRFYTKRGKALADARKASAAAFYESMLSETRACCAAGKRALSDMIE